MFKLKQNNTTVRTELVAGITTFMAMAYILMVNAGMFSTLGGDALGASYYNAVYIATALSAVFGTLLIGLLSNLPLAQASGMGLNAFFVYSVCIGMGFTYANALVMVLVDGIVFLLLTVTGPAGLSLTQYRKLSRLQLHRASVFSLHSSGFRIPELLLTAIPHSLTCTRSTLSSATLHGQR